MKYYKFYFTTHQYILDISFFIELLQESIDYDIKSILTELNIEAVELDYEIELDQDKIYIQDNDQIIEYNLTFDICEKVKNHYINKFYKLYSFKSINMLMLKSFIDNTSIKSYLNLKYPIIKSDKESAYLEILNTGDINEINILEKYLEFNDSFINSAFSNLIDEKEIIGGYNNLNELMIALILFYNNNYYDYNSLNISKQLK